MTRTALFDAIRPFAPDRRLSPDAVATIDALADRFGLPAAAERRAGAEALAIIERFEGLRLRAYQDSGGVWTIGYGHTGPDVHSGLTIDAARAHALLVQDVAAAEAAVRQLCPGTTQPQFDALVSFAFNLGAERLAQSTLRRLHNAGDFAGARAQFARWVHDDGVRLRGLEARRAAEAARYGAEA